MASRGYAAKAQAIRTGAAGSNPQGTHPSAAAPSAPRVPNLEPALQVPGLVVDARAGARIGELWADRADSANEPRWINNDFFDPRRGNAAEESLAAQEMPVGFPPATMQALLGPFLPGTWTKVGMGQLPWRDMAAGVLEHLAPPDPASLRPPTLEEMLSDLACFGLGGSAVRKGQRQLWGAWLLDSIHTVVCVEVGLATRQTRGEWIYNEQFLALFGAELQAAGVNWSATTVGNVAETWAWYGLALGQWKALGDMVWACVQMRQDVVIGRGDAPRSLEAHPRFLLWGNDSGEEEEEAARQQRRRGFGPRTADMRPPEIQDAVAAGADAAHAAWPAARRGDKRGRELPGDAPPRAGPTFSVAGSSASEQVALHGHVEPPRERVQLTPRGATAQADPAERPGWSDAGGRGWDHPPRRWNRERAERPRRDSRRDDFYHERRGQRREAFRAGKNVTVFDPPAEDAPGGRFSLNLVRCLWRGGGWEWEVPEEVEAYIDGWAYVDLAKGMPRHLAAMYLRNRVRRYERHFGRGPLPQDLDRWFGYRGQLRMPEIPPAGTAARDDYEAERAPTSRAGSSSPARSAAGAGSPSPRGDAIQAPPVGGRVGERIAVHQMAAAAPPEAAVPAPKGGAPQSMYPGGPADGDLAGSGVLAQLSVPLPAVAAPAPALAAATEAAGTKDEEMDDGAAPASGA
ncbi:MAG: hypothetical protein AAFS07_18765 [Pseudomonadota bacterium]